MPWSGSNANALTSLQTDLRHLRALPPRAELHASGTLALLFAGLALAVWSLGGYHAGFAPINARGGLLPAEAWSLLTFAGDALLTATISLLFARRYPDMVWQLLLATVIASLFVRFGKVFVPLHRPPGVLEPGSFHLVGPGWRQHSFPSGHATTLLSFACVWGAYLEWKRRSLLLALAGLLAATRVFVGVHWPVDVLAGAAVGCASALAALWLSRYWRWGLSLGGHLFGVLLLAGCAIAMLFYAGGYEAPRLPAALLAAITLLTAARDYSRRRTRIAAPALRPASAAAG